MNRMTLEEINLEIKKLNLSRSEICKDLGFTNGDLSNYLNGKKPLPKSRQNAFEWYFKFKNLENKMP